MRNFRKFAFVGCSALAVAACGADDVVAPGGPIIINPTPTPSGSPTPSPSPSPGAGSVTAAASCTAGTTDGGTVSLQNNRGTIRNCVIPTQISGTLTLTGRRADGIMYSMSGRTDVGRDIDLAGGAAATLNVLPGVTVFAATRETTLVVNRGSRINGDGTQAQPIIFTALANLTGQGLTDATDNLWGGLIINGRAPISDCDTTVNPAGTVGGTATCWRRSEGLTQDTLYGGNVAADNSGTLRYVQVNFTGVGNNGDEVQGITTNGTGSGTTMSYLQIHNSRDDGIESFGGTQNMDHLVLTGIADDSLDTDLGYVGAVQYVFAARRATGTTGDSVSNQTLLEIDSAANPDAFPRQYLRLANFTLLQTTANEPAIRLRGGADADFVNGIVIARVGGTQGCLDVDNAETVRAAGDAPGTQAPSGTTPDRGPPRFLSVVFDCQVVIDADADAFEETALANPANAGLNRTFTNTLQLLTGSTVGLVANGANETGVTAASSIPAISSFFQQVAYIGAFSGPGDNWTQGWTCNSDIANLRGVTNCTDIRIS